MKARKTWNQSKAVMMMRREIPSRLEKIIQDYASGLRDVYGEKLIRVTLFGSYARGDFTDASDIDVLIVVDLSEAELEEFRKAMIHLTFETNLEHDVEIEPVVMTAADYFRYEAVHPLLMEIKKDGVSLYAA